MKSFSELTSASQVNNEDLVAISQTSGSGYASKKTTVKDITDKSNLNLAEEYDSTSTYAVDDYVIYESVLYKCIATTTGTFDSTKWTSVVVTDEMGSGGGGGTGGHTIIDENGNSMTARSGLQFFGAVEVTDDSANNRTLVEVLGGDFYNPVIYSTEERVIGVWKDGRPLYQKTVDFGALPNDSTKTVSYNISDLDYFVKIQCVAHNQNGSRNIPFVDDGVKTSDVSLDTIKSSGVIRIIAHTDLSSLTGDVTLRYVKSSDTAGSGSWTPQGVPTVHYSTDEQVIGTWLGETLYQKTLHISNVQFDSTGVYDLDLTSMGTDILIADNSCSYYTFSTYVHNFEKLVPEDGHIYCYGVANRPITDGYITIKYTKSS